MVERQYELLKRERMRVAEDQQKPSIAAPRPEENESAQPQPASAISATPESSNPPEVSMLCIFDHQNQAKTHKKMVTVNFSKFFLFILCKKKNTKNSSVNCPDECSALYSGNRRRIRVVCAFLLLFRFFLTLISCAFFKLFFLQSLTNFAWSFFLVFLILL